MAQENDAVMAEVMSLLEAEPAPAALPATLPAVDFPALREQLAILVCTGKCKEAIGVDLTHEQVRKLSDKDVMRYCKRYEAHIGARTTESMVENFLSASTRALSLGVRIKDIDAIQERAEKRLYHHRKNFLLFLAAFH